jgi:hypothetical protein
MYAIFFHAHQKIDRIAHRHLRRLAGGQTQFPTVKNILHFEGRNGPDATKLKNKSGVEQPWHFVDPFNEADTDLDQTIQYHYDELVDALRTKNAERSAFEAAWLAHALVDGLTPAHHYPYEQALETLRGKDRSSRTSLSSRVVVKGDTRRDTVNRSLKIVGPKGLLTTHTAFEAGAFMIMTPLKLTRAFPDDIELREMREMGLVAYFHRQAREIGAYDMYGHFYKSGWTPKLARVIRRELAPRLVAIVTLAWNSALLDAGRLEKGSKPK